MKEPLLPSREVTATGTTLTSRTLHSRSTTRCIGLLVDSRNLIIQAQGIVPEDEWEAFMTSLKADLPTTFRVTGSRA